MKKSPKGRKIFDHANGDHQDIENNKNKKIKKNLIMNHLEVISSES